jgi:undecaprenyl-diphosphatase
MTLWQAIALGVLQGITEFLPVSSSGHLVLLERLFGLQHEQLAIVVFLHFGTLLSILVVFRNDIVEMFSVQRRLIGLILLGSVPAALVGFGFHRLIEESFSHLFVVGVCLLITGLLLTLAERARQILRSSLGELERTDMSKMRALDALLIGVAQAVAVLPGLSRSGSTIAAALLCGLKREAAASFSFLLAIPALGGATALELKRVLAAGTLPVDTMTLVVGVATAFVTGVVALKILISVLQRRRLLIFAGYCFIVGASVVVWDLSQR